MRAGTSAEGKSWRKRGGSLAKAVPSKQKLILGLVENVGPAWKSCRQHIVLL